MHCNINVESCPPNEYYTECYPTGECIPTCGNPEPYCNPQCNEAGVGQCVCIYGYVRHTGTGACVQAAHCWVEYFYYLEKLSLSKIM